MSLYGRITTAIGSKINKMLDRIEDPREMLDYSLEQQQDLLVKVKSSIVAVVTAKKQLQHQKKLLEDSIIKYDSQAKEAVLASREDLASLAIERKNNALNEIKSLTLQIEGITKDQEKLEDQSRKLEIKINSFRATKETLKAQYTAADARAKAVEAVSGIGDESNNVGNTIERARNKTEEKIARASALDELVENGTLEDFSVERKDDIDRELSKLKSKPSVEMELQKLKESLNSTLK